MGTASRVLAKRAFRVCASVGLRREDDSEDPREYRAKLIPLAQRIRLAFMMVVEVRNGLKARIV